MISFIQKHQEQISCTLSCFDRVVLTGTLPDICYDKAMTSYLYNKHIKIFDYPGWAENLKNELKNHIEALAQRSGISIDFIRKQKSFRKEEQIKEIIAQRGEHPGIVHIYSAMESCSAYRPWHNKQSHQTYIKSTSGKCLHYYIYFIDAAFGLCYMRIPTWSPFRLQVYFNGHYWLAQQLQRHGIEYEMRENAFTSLSDPEKAQQLANSLNARQLHKNLEKWTKAYCPIISNFNSQYHWSFMQVEWATDIVFKQQKQFQPLYEAITRRAVIDIKADQIATFLGRKMTGQYRDEMGNDFSTRIQGTRIRHKMGSTSIKLYDKFGLISRVECTSNNINFFKIRREVEQRNGEVVMKNAPLRKNIYSMKALRKLMEAANQRYLNYMASIDNPDSGQKACEKIAQPAKEKNRSYRGFNFLQEQDIKLFCTIMRGEWTINGFRAKDLRQHMKSLTSSQSSYLLKRLRTHGIIKKVGHCYKYYISTFGQQVLATVLKLKQELIIPALCKSSV